MAVWAVIALGMASGLLPRSRPSTVAAVAVTALGIFAAIAMLALDYTSSDERTVEELARILGYLGVVVLAYLSLSRYTAPAAAAGLAFALLALPFFSVASRLAPSVLTDETTEVLGVDRLSYPLGYWNAVSCWCAMAMAAGLIWSAHARTNAVRAAALATVPVAGLALYLTYSRAGVGAVAIAVLVALAVSSRRWPVVLNGVAAAGATGLAILVARNQPEIASATGSDGAATVALTLAAGMAACAGVAVAVARTGLDDYKVDARTARVAVVSVAVIVVLGALTAGRGPIERGWDEFRNEGAPVRTADPSERLSSLGGSRYSAWSSAVDAFDDESGRGIGPGTYEFYWAQNGDKPEFFRDAHSLYLETLAETGVLGGLALAVFLVAAFLVALSALRSKIRTWEHGAVGAMVAVFAVFAFYAAVDWVWEVPALVVLGLGGLAVAGAAGFDRWGSTRMSRWWRAAAAVAALLAMAVQVPGLTSTERQRASATALSDGDTDMALTLADESVDAAPWAATPYVQRALVYEAEGNLDEARSDLDEAVEREPLNFRHHLLLARVEARAGDAAVSRAELRRARELSPNSVLLAPGSLQVLELEALLDEAGGRPSP